MTNKEAIKIFKDRDLVGRKIFIDEAIDLAIEALEKVERLEETYHNFLGYDLAKCVKYGNENEEQRADSYSTMMMYEIAQAFDDLLD